MCEYDMAIKREAEFGSLFRHWLRSQKQWEGSAAFELKQTREHSIPFSDVQDHQIAALEASQATGLLYKIPDDSRGVKPFDMVFLQFARAYVVIRYPKFFCLISVGTFTAERDRSDRKSLIESKAREIADICVEL